MDSRVAESEAGEVNEYRQAIWKFPCDPGLRSYWEIQMPKGAQILTVDVQRGAPCIWALVEPSSEEVTRAFAWFGTGHDIVGRDYEFLHRHYIGTVLLNNDSFVFHLFERPTETGQDNGEET